MDDIRAIFLIGMGLVILVWASVSFGNYKSPQDRVREPAVKFPTGTGLIISGTIMVIIGLIMIAAAFALSTIGTVGTVIALIGPPSARGIPIGNLDFLAIEILGGIVGSALLICGVVAISSARIMKVLRFLPIKIAQNIPIAELQPKSAAD